MSCLKARLIVVSIFCAALPVLFWQPPALAQTQPVDFAPLGELARDVAGIGLVVGLVFFLARKAMPENVEQWYFHDRPWLVNLSVIIVSVGVAVLGAWLNALNFAPRNVIEYIWLGLFSAAVATLGYEFSKNLGRDGSE